MERSLAERLSEYVTQERAAARLCARLAQEESDPFRKEVLASLAAEEEKHAEIFSAIFRRMTGEAPETPLLPVGEPDADLRSLVLQKSRRLSVYAEEYERTSALPLKRAFLRAFTDESSHALRLLSLVL